MTRSFLPMRPWVALSLAVLLPAILVALLLPGALAALQQGKELGERHLPRAWDEPFDFEQADYGSYEAWATRQLQQGLGTEALPRALAPYRVAPAADCPVPEDRPWHNGIVLLHDVQESPYQWQDLARALSQRCFAVVVPLLPGHGTVPGDLLRSSWQDWHAVQTLALRELSGQVNNLFLGGLGAGATLALLGAAEHPEVDALLLFAPVLQPRELPWYSPAAALLASWIPEAQWGATLPDDTPYRHESWPLPLLQQVNGLVAATSTYLPEAGADLPVFALASTDDREAPAAAILDYMRGMRHPDSRTLLYTRDFLPEQTGVQQVSTRRPDLALQGLGHEALIVSLGDPVFGQLGSQRDCLHYYNRDPERWQLCREGRHQLFGEPNAETLALGVLRRPGFNMFFTQLLDELDGFLAPVARRPEVVPF